MHIMEATRPVSALATAGYTLAACATPHPLPVERLEATLDAHDSATQALAHWCRGQGLANDPTIRAVATEGQAGAAPADLHDLLDISAGTPLGYRHVRLVCGETVLSIAQNWFVPERLTPRMNEVLATTQIPFGTAVAELGFVRRKLSSSRGGEPGCPQGTVLSQRARLELPDGRPISLVVECYTAANLTPGW